MLETAKLTANAATAESADLSALNTSLGLDVELTWLYRRHAALMVRYGQLLCKNRETSSEAVQEVFLKYFELRQSGADIENPRAWLFRALRNHLIDGQRKSSYRATISPEFARAVADPSAAADTATRMSDAWRQIEAKVSPKELEALRLRSAGFTYAEMAEIMGVQIGTVSVFITRGLEKTRGIFQALATEK